MPARCLRTRSLSLSRIWSQANLGALSETTVNVCIPLPDPAEGSAPDVKGECEKALNANELTANDDDVRFVCNYRGSEEVCISSIAAEQDDFGTFGGKHTRVHKHTCKIE